MRQAMNCDTTAAAGARDRAQVSPEKTGMRLPSRVPLIRPLIPSSVLPADTFVVAVELEPGKWRAVQGVDSLAAAERVRAVLSEQRGNYRVIPKHQVAWQ